MNKLKLSKILGVGLALVMVFSLMVGFLPAQKAQAAEGEMQWAAQPLPTNNFFVLDQGSNAADVAIGPDGSTIYAIDSAAAANAAGCILKSINGGQSFGAITAPGTLAGTTLSHVAVAPDNPSVVMVSIFSAAATDNVSVSTNGGITWTQLPVLAAPCGATTDIMGIAVGPARYDALLGREYLVAAADSAAGVAAGDLQVVGITSTWFSFVTSAAAPAADYMACAFSPNYLSDHAILELHATAALTAVSVWNNTLPIAPGVYAGFGFPRTINGVVIDFTGAATGITDADIAIPSDFDPTIPSGMRFWASIASIVADGLANAGGIYRVDAAQTPELFSPAAAIAANQRIKSIAYSGDTINGTLFAGLRSAVGITGPVSYTTQASTNLPVFTPSRKAPTGNAGVPVVRVSPNFAANKTVYAVALGNESAFSISTDGGFSFNQEAMIDNNTANTVVVVDDMAMTGDGKTLFVVTRAGGIMNLWQTATAPTDTSWSRIYCTTPPANTRCRIAINKGEWATNPEIYLVNTTVGTPAGLFASYDAGASFSIRSTPFAAVNHMGVASSKTIFIASGTNVSKSTNGGAVWLPTVPANVGAIATVVPFGGNVLVGGTGLASLSTDGGASYTPIATGLTAGIAYGVIPDGNYATNNTVYAFGVSAAGNIFRINTATGTLWENMINTNALTMVSFGGGGTKGGLYGIFAGGADRTLGPTDALGEITWRTMNINAPGVFTRAVVSANKVYASQAVPDLWAYNDALATAKTTITSPVSGTKVPVDPVTGRAQTLMVSWNAMGTSTGLVNNYLLGIFEKAQGVPGASFIGTGAMPLPTAPRMSIYPLGVALFVAPDINYTFLAGVEYGIIIRAADEVSGDTIVSPWSDPVYFTIEAATGVITAPYGGPILQAPTPGAMGVSLTPGFAWAPVTGAVKYEFELSKSAATTARGYFIDALVGLTGTNALVTPGWQCDITLDYGTSYFWHVKGITADGAESIWGTAQFTTPAAGVFTCPLDGLTFATQAELEAHNAAAHAPVIPQTPAYIWAVVIIGAILVIVVIALIFTTRRVS
jgi:hypothetical protein